jgi:hypothetical protein
MPTIAASFTFHLAINRPYDTVLPGQATGLGLLSA